MLSQVPISQPVRAFSRHATLNPPPSPHQIGGSRLSDLERLIDRTADYWAIIGGLAWHWNASEACLTGFLQRLSGTGTVSVAALLSDDDRHAERSESRLDELAAATDPDEHARLLARYLTDFGHLVYHLDIAEPTLAEDPTAIQAALHARHHRPTPGTDAGGGATARRRDAEQQIQQRLPPVPGIRAVWSRLLRWAQHWADVRDQTLHAFTAGWPVLRAGYLELGRRLHRAGIIDHADEVFYLTSAELQVALFAGVAAGLIYALRHLDLATLGTALRSADPWLLVIAAAANLGSQVTRSVGWNALLPTRVMFRRLVRYEFAVQTASAVSPEGSGELARVGYLRSEGIPATTTVSLMAARKLLSSVGLVPLILLAALLAAGTTAVAPGWAVTVLLVYSAAMIVLLTAAVAFAPHRPTTSGPIPGRVVETHPNPAADRGRQGRWQRIAGALSAARSALAPLRNRSAMGQCLAAAVATRTLDLVGAGAVLASLGLTLPLWQIVLVLVLIEVSNVLPSAPAQLGTFEAAVLLGVAGALPAAQSVAFALLLHTQQMLPQVVAGLAVMISPRHPHQPSRARQET